MQLIHVIHTFTVLLDVDNMKRILIVNTTYNWSWGFVNCNFNFMFNKLYDNMCPSFNILLFFFSSLFSRQQLMGK